MTKKQQKKEGVNREKYKNAILFFADKMDRYELGSTKLAKLFYYLDFISFRDRKKKVIGANYYKQDYGPLIEDFQDVVAELVEEGGLELQKLKLGDGREVHNYNAKREPRVEVFEDKEVELLNLLVDKYRKWDVKKLTAKSHLELPWRKAKEGGRLDFQYAYDIDDFDEKRKAEYEEEDRKLREEIVRQACGA